MADDDLQSWFKDLPRKLQRELAGGLKEIADDLAADVRSAAPEKSGKLKQSVRVRRGRNTLELFVEAGGTTTTKQVREGSGIAYDYALGVEFGNSHIIAQPFFYSTYRAKQSDVRQKIESLVNDVMAKA